MCLEKTTVKIRCEMGACKNPAAYTVRPARVGIRSRLHICEPCLRALGQLIDDTLPKQGTEESVIPKSIETLKPKKRKTDILGR